MRTSSPGRALRARVVSAGGEQELFALHDYKVFRASRVKRKVGDCIFNRNKIRVVELGLKFLGVFGEDDPIAIAISSSCTHASIVYAKGNILATGYSLGMHG